jgi:glycerate kinase
LLEGCPIVPPPTPPKLPSALIPRRLLIAASAFGPALDANEVTERIGRGLEAGGSPEPDLCPLEDAGAASDPRELLDALDFDARMRSARAVVIAAPILQEQTLAGSLAFEIATRARQGGVPAYAVTAENRLDAFDARIMDLQAIVEAADARALRAAGKRLAAIV